MGTKLERTAEILATTPKPEFTSLYHLINAEMLTQCHKELDGKKAVGIDKVTKAEYDVHGEGCSTTRLVEVADQIIKDAKIIYQNVWIVFDKDDFDDFDQAIQEDINRGYNVAWSNQSFEYWLYLHFYYSGTALHRHQWNAKLDEIFKKNNLGNGTYQKNYDDIYSLADIYGGVNAAIKHSKRRMAEFEKGGYKPSEYDPGTMVYKLVESLKEYLE